MTGHLAWGKGLCHFIKSLPCTVAIVTAIVADIYIKGHAIILRPGVDGEMRFPPEPRYQLTPAFFPFSSINWWKYVPKAG